MNDDVIINMTIHIDYEKFLKAVNGDEEVQKDILKGVAVKAIDCTISEFAQTKVWIDLDKSLKFNI